MKLWQKILIVFVGGGIVWTLSYLTSVKPELAMILSSANATIVGLVAFFTGFTPKPTA
jgi:hypothetical protein